MTTKRLYVKADITDWRDEAFQLEYIPKDKEEILDGIEKGMHTAQVARAIIVSRELKEAPEDIINENKLLLLAGAMKSISEIVHSVKTEIETVSGKTWNIPGFIGNPEDGEGDSYVPSDSYQGRERAEKYLKTVVVGHIRNRLALIFQTGGDAKESAMWLKLKIDSLVDELIEPGQE